ncbi:MAG: fumarylacetoacetate hydrolase family protein [Actinomycetota bacterium]
MTGTPPGVGEMRPGDVVEVVIEGIGTLRNTVSPEMQAPASPGDGPVPQET